MNQSVMKRSLFLPTIADILFISILMYLLFIGYQGLLADGDTGYHIRAGEVIIDTLSIPRHDIFSFHAPKIPWTAHEWLSEVVMASLHRLFGLSGVLVFFAFVISFIYYLLFRIIRTYGGNILISILVLLLVMASSNIHWLARPHIFSLLCVLIWYYLLDEFQYNNRAVLFLLPPLMILWVNLHGGYIIGLILTGIYLCCNFISFMFTKSPQKKEMGKKSRYLGLTLMVCLFASLINPYGYHILLFPFKLTSNKFIMDHINEFMSPNFHEPMFFTYLLFCLIAILAISKKRLHFIECVLALFFTYMSLYSARYIPLFGIIISPIVIRQADGLISEADGRFKDFLKKRDYRISSADASARGYIWPSLAVVAAFSFIALGTMDYSFDQESRPVAAVDFLKTERINGNMFNNDEFGDYIIYAAWPEYRVFFDGRSDMYGTEKMKEYFQISQVEPGFDDVIDKYDITWIFFDSQSALSQYLLIRDDWSLIYSDNVANIFLKDIPENRQLIHKYKGVTPFIEKEE